MATKSEHLLRSPVDIDKVNGLVALCTTATASIASPAAIIGLIYLLGKWLSDATLENVYVAIILTFVIGWLTQGFSADVHRVLVAYTVDLILVMKELFKIALQPKVFGRVSWTELEEAFEAYGRTASLRTIHDRVRALVDQHAGLSADRSFVQTGIEHLIQQHP
ncbi:hypothetical protein B0H13DRAFT_2303568 [Mycena leptocephala]|nr:hypothetical protein B0H13DRAFT_2303568 [Mycena leptocephala]